MIITIDGPAGTGKSTVAKCVANLLEFLYFDTGAMYRAFTWFVLHSKIPPSDEASVKKLLSGFSFDIKEIDKQKHYFVNAQDITKEIRSLEITQSVSIVAAYPFVRKQLVEIQHKYGSTHNAVFEGRDMGSVVFPEAELKIFLTADPQVRANRRYLELTEKFPEQHFDEAQILKDIQTRDELDSSRSVSPLVQAEDAHLIDTSRLSIEEVISEIIRLYKNKHKRKKNWFYNVIIFATRVIGKIFYRLQIKGLENFPKGGGLVIANHTSFFDPPIIAAACPEEVHFIARDTLFKKGFFGWLILRLNAHPVSRSKADTRALKEVNRLLQNGCKVIMFPEGSRSKDGKLQAFRSGVGYISYKANCNIIPVYIRGAHRIWKKGSLFPKFWGKVECYIGKPINPNCYSTLERKAAIEGLTKDAEKAIKNLQDTFK